MIVLVPLAARLNSTDSCEPCSLRCVTNGNWVGARWVQHCVTNGNQVGARWVQHCVTNGIWVWSRWAQHWATKKERRAGRYEKRNDRPEPPEGWKEAAGKWKDGGSWKEVGKAWVDVGKAWKDGKTEPSDLEKIIGEAQPISVTSVCLIQGVASPAAELTHQFWLSPRV